MSKLIKNWEELNGLDNGKYVIRVKDNCRGYIEPKVETEETEKDYANHHAYLSTHTFYGSHYKYSTKLLQSFGFDVELDNWDKEKDNVFEKNISFDFKKDGEEK